MNHRHRIALLVSTGMACCVAIPAAAQSASAQSDVAATNAVPRSNETDDIVVTGIRASLQRAQDVKRLASSVVEAITSEDIGKFTDSSLTDALQRVPGVAVSRNYRGQDQGDGIAIRGLGREYAQTTVNGRELLGNPDFFGNNGRNFDFGSVPPDILGSILVYKSPTADIVEAGLAGEIDLRTIRPLDVNTKGRLYFASLTAAGFYDQKSREMSPQLNGVLGGKFFGNTLGIYVSGVYSREKTLFDQLYNYHGVHTLNFANANATTTQVPGIVAPNGFGYRHHEQNLKRDSVAAGLQWKPDDRLEINADFLYYKYSIDILQRNSDYVGAGFVGKFDTDAVIQPGAVVIQGRDVVYFDTSRINGAGAPYQRAGGLLETSPNKAFNYGLNVAWHNDNGLKISADGSYNKTDFFQFWRGFFGTNDAAGGSNVTWDIRGRTFPLIVFSGPSNISDPAQYNFNSLGGSATGGSLFSFQSFARNRRWSGRFDIAQSVGDQFAIKLGARYTRTTASFVNAIFLKNPPQFNSAGFFKGVDVPPFYNVAVPRIDFSAVCRNNPAYCVSDNRGRGSFTGSFPTSAAGNPGDLYGFDPADSYYIKESKLSLYGQVDFKGGVAGMPILGNLGLRAVRLDTQGKGFQGVIYRIGNENGPPSPTNPDATNLVTDGAVYWRYLPSLNVTFQPRENINLRFSVAETISQAQYATLAPRGNARVILPDANGGAQRSIFSGGNARLKPTSALNFDLTLEYYTKGGGSFIASAFYKDVKDLIQASNVVGTVPGQGGREFEIRSVSNNQKGRVFGFELGANQPFTFLPGMLAGFGIQANYTYIDTRTADINFGNIPFGGSSKHNLNTSLYYDRDGWNARMAYFYRSREYQITWVPGDNREITPQYSLDFSLSKKILPFAELRFNVVNITKKDVLEVNTSSDTLANFYERPRTFLFGARFTY